MKSAVALIAELQRGFLAEALLHRRGPLLHVLRLLIRVERGETGDRLAHHRRTEVEAQNRWRKAVALIRLGEDDGHVVQVVAPRIHVDRKSTRLNSSHLVISYAVFCL